MPKFKIKLIISLVTLLLFLPVGLLLSEEEYEKKIAKAREGSDLQKQIRSDLQKYRDDYLKYISDEKESNRRKMLETKLAYEFLLREQNKILNEHKRQVLATNISPTGSQYTAANSSGTTTVKKKVTKPAATRSTRSS